MKRSRPKRGRFEDRAAGRFVLLFRGSGHSAPLMTVTFHPAARGRLAGAINKPGIARVVEDVNGGVWNINADLLGGLLMYGPSGYQDWSVRVGPTEAAYLVG